MRAECMEQGEHFEQINLKEGQPKRDQSQESERA